MSEIKSVAEAACEFAPFSKGMADDNISFQTERRLAFIDGANWQKEQDKEFIQLAWKLLVAYDTRYPNAKQLLLSITNEDAFNKLSQLI